jgi:hypothetical protein
MTYAQASRLLAPFQRQLEWQESGARRASSIAFATLRIDVPLASA